MLPVPPHFFGTVMKILLSLHKSSLWYPYDILAYYDVSADILQEVKYMKYSYVTKLLFAEITFCYSKKTLLRVQHYWTSFSIFWKGKTFPSVALTFSFFSATTTVQCLTMSQLINSRAWEAAAEITTESSSCSGLSQSHFSASLAKCIKIFLQVKPNCISHGFVYL